MPTNTAQLRARIAAAKRRNQIAASVATFRDSSALALATSSESPVSPRLSTGGRPSRELIRRVLRRLGYVGAAATKAERHLLEARPGVPVKVGDHAVTVKGRSLNVTRSRPGTETR